MIMSMIIMVIIISSTTMVTVVLVFLAILINHQLYTFIQFVFHIAGPDLNLPQCCPSVPHLPFLCFLCFLLQSEAIILVFRSDLFSLGKQEMV